MPCPNCCTLNICGRKRMKNADAYFTVEAALVLPVLMGAILFVIYILFFQYDRCLLEQDLGAMALWGSRLEESGQERLEEKVQERVRGLYKEKYMAWDFAVLEASLEKNTFSAKGAGRVNFPLPGWDFCGVGNIMGEGGGYKKIRPPDTP